VRQCRLCRSDVYDFELARSYAAYDEAAAKAIVLLKYHAVTPLAGWFAAQLESLVRAEGIVADVVVPVPLDRARRRERGHNQAELIARPLARRLGIPMRAALLLRTRPRPEKPRLTRRERWTTVRGAYRAREGTGVDKLRVLLVDDVFTTGATLDACSRALRKAGAAGVIGVTVARVGPRGAPPSPQPAAAPASPPVAGQSPSRI
jgi:ComF family protein